MSEQNHTTQKNELINLMLTDGLGEAAPKIMELIMNAAMIVERNAHPNSQINRRTRVAGLFPNNPSLPT